MSFTVKKIRIAEISGPSTGNPTQFRVGSTQCVG